MPGLIESIALIASSIATTVAGANAIYFGVQGILSIGLSLGLSWLSSLLAPKPKAPKPEDMQTSLREPLAPRTRHYGRVKVSGSWVFADSKDGHFHKVLALGQGPCDAIEEVWVDDKLVQIDSENRVTTEPYKDGDKYRLKIFTNTGTATPTQYTELTSAFPGWTASHLGKGVISLYAKQFAVKQDVYLKLFQNGIYTNYRVVMKGVPVYNILNGRTEWTDNAASITRDFLISKEGMRLPEALVNTPLAKQGWSYGAKVCAQSYETKSGQPEPRYRVWGSYSLDERPADVLNRILASSDSRLMLTPDGGLTIDVGEFRAPTVTIDDSMIIGFSDVGRGLDILSTANTIRATFLHVNGDYQSGDADPWVNNNDVSIRGEIAQDVEFIMAPSHSQCRRLMKVAAYRANPNWVGTFTCNLKALPAFGQRFIRINMQELGINEVFEINDFKFNIGENNILHSVTIQVSSMPQAAYNWSMSEEGTAPVSENSETAGGIPVGGTVGVTIIRKNVGGQKVPFARLAFDEPPSAALNVELRGRVKSSSDWQTIPLGKNATQAESFMLSDGEEYQFQMRYVTYSQKPGSWGPITEITAIADNTPPDDVTNVEANGGSGKATITWTAPNSANYAGAIIYRGTVNLIEFATVVRTEYGAPNQNDSFVDQSLSSGTYYYWVQSRNASGTKGNPVATGSVNVS